MSHYHSSINPRFAARMKVVAFLNAYTQGLSGGDLRFVELMKRLEEKGDIELTVVTSKLGKDLCRERGLNAVFKVTTWEREVRAVGNVVLLFARRIISALSLRLLIEGSVLYSASNFLPDVFPAFFYKLVNKESKWVVCVYHIIPHPSKRPGKFSLSNFISFIAQCMSLLLVARCSDMIQTETNFVKYELVRRYRISPEKIIVCQSGINPKVIDNFSWSKGKIYDACFLARLHKSKGIYDLIEAWKYVCKYNKGAKLAIGGGGLTEMVTGVKNRIKNLGLENNVFYLGFLSEEDKYRLLRASELYVLPSYEEGIPITFYEAMYCGLPVVTYYLPTYSDIKDYIVSVPLGDVKSLVDAIIRVLENEGLVRTLGDSGRSLAKQHTWDKVAEYTMSQILKISL